MKADNIYCKIYGGVLLWLLIGFAGVANTRGLTGYAIYIASFLFAAYIFFQKAPAITCNFRSGNEALESVKAIIILLATVFPMAHWISLGDIPLFSAFATADYWQTVLIRQNVFQDAGAFWRYGASLTIVAIMPFLVLLFFVQKRRHFWLFALYALFYAASLLQKSHVIVVFLPAIIYALGNKRFKAGMQLAALSVFAVLVLMAATNPSIRPTFNWLIPPATAAAIDSSDNHVSAEGWTAYGNRQGGKTEGKFRPGSLYFPGNASVFKKRAGTEWEIGRSDFWMEFWAYPATAPLAGQLSALYWNGADEDFRGASYINYGSNAAGATYLEFGIADVSGKRSLAIHAKHELKLNQWNHIYVARAGNNWYLGLNGVMVHGQQDVDLSLNDNSKGIVQFGARFGGKTVKESSSFFSGYIDEISFSKEPAKFTADYALPKAPPAIQSLRPSDITHFSAAPPKSQRNSIALAKLLPGWAATLIHRVMFTPGEVVAQWFAAIPDELPFAYGCGYRPLAAVLGCTHQNFSKLIYAHYNADLSEKGIYGTINAASFMEDYANFGLFGLFGSGVLIALLLYLLGIVFAKRRLIGVALNMVPLLYLSSTALLSLLLSGGWALTILLYVIYHSEFNDISQNKVCVASQVT